MQVLQGQYHLGSVEFGTSLGKSNLIAQVKKHFTTVAEVCDKVESLRRLESVMKLDDERMRDLLHDISLNLCVVHLVCSDDEVFLQRFDRVDLLRVLLARHVHFAEGATTDDFEQLEIFDSQLFLFGVCTTVIE